MVGHFTPEERALEATARLLEALAAEPDPPTTVRSPRQALDRHVADSLEGLAVEPLARARSIIDIGSGAGFPGLVLAAALPHSRVDLLESSGRKCEVIERLAQRALLNNARVIQVRAEEWGASAGREAYDAASARAVAAQAVVLEYAAPLLRVGGTLVSWKGARDEREERDAAAAASLLGFRLCEVRSVAPFTGVRERKLHVYTKTVATPGRFPRRPGVASKRPLR